MKDSLIVGITLSILVFFTLLLLYAHIVAGKKIKILKENCNKETSYIKLYKGDLNENIPSKSFF